MAGPYFVNNCELSHFADQDFTSMLRCIVNSPRCGSFKLYCDQSVSSLVSSHLGFEALHRSVNVWGCGLCGVVVSFVLNLCSLSRTEKNAWIEKWKQGQCDFTIGPFFPMGTKLQLGRALLGCCVICVQITYFVYEYGCADGWIDTRMQDTWMMSGIMRTGRVYSSNL